MRRELQADELRWRCPEEWLPEGEIEPADSIVGQERAVEAIEWGLQMPGVGYNIFVTGLSGTGRLTTITTFLDRLPGTAQPPPDVCYVASFRDPSRPRALLLAAGAGRRLAAAVDAMVRELAEHLDGIFSSEEFRAMVESAVAALQADESRLLAGLQEQVRAAGFSLVQIQGPGGGVRPEVLPVVGEEPVPLEALAELAEEGKLSAEEAERLREVHHELARTMRETFARAADLHRQMRDRATAARLDAIRPFLDVVVERVRQHTADPAADAFLADLRRDLEDHLEAFAPSEDDEDGAGDPFSRWRVNVVVDNGDVERRPVVLETEPTHANVFGTIERRLQAPGDVVSDHTAIRAGSLLRAGGGFLVLAADDLLEDPRVWPSLKRALKYRRVQVQAAEPGLLGASGLKPEAVPLDAKVVVIGDRGVYDLLYRHDPDFAKIFKVLADFDSLMTPGPEAARAVLGVLAKVIRDEGLLPLERSGMAAMLEVAVRQGHWRRHFSSRFSDLADVLREASFAARGAGAGRIGAAHVQSAVEAARRRHGLSEERVHRTILEGSVVVETEGMRVGQVNGLAVWDLGHHRFGAPSRISAQVGIGREGVISIERQAGLSGPIHDKGVAILTGFLRGLFALTTPLSMSCSITFEQSYGGVDGDSASSTEAYAVLSALAGVPLRQDVAVTGSVDQLGRIQTIGGVNQKVEGFFRICRERGLTGEQGVMIPAGNVGDLQLDREVTAAVEQGRFHVIAVETVAEGIEVLTGLPAGERGDDGSWPDDSVYGRCQRRLERMTRDLRAAGGDPGGPFGEPGGD